MINDFWFLQMPIVDDYRKGGRKGGLVVPRLCRSCVFGVCYFFCLETVRSCSFLLLSRILGTRGVPLLSFASAKESSKPAPNVSFGTGGEKGSRPEASGRITKTKYERGFVRSFLKPLMQSVPAAPSRCGN